MSSSGCFILDELCQETPGLDMRSFLPSLAQMAIGSMLRSQRSGWSLEEAMRSGGGFEKASVGPADRGPVIRSW